MPKPQAYEPLRAKYEITDQERATIEMLLRATLQIVQPEAGRCNLALHCPEDFIDTTAILVPS